ncbi:MAG: tetratricopeptide repeat protein [Paracoccaceae bacterium]
MAFSKSTASFALTLAIALSGITSPVKADGFAGAYLAAREAGRDSDFEAAARYFTRALVQDSKNPSLMQNAILAYVSNGDFDRAMAIVRRLNGLGEANQVSNMVFLAESVKKGDFEAAFELLEKGETVGPLVDGLALAWIEVGQGNMSAALGSFEQVASGEGLQSFGLYHKALALSVAGDLESAEEILSGQSGAKIPPTRAGTIAHVEILSQLERNDEALALLEEIFGNDLDPGLLTIREALQAGDTLPLTAVKNAQDGVAEVFFTVAGALAGEANDGYTLIYTRVAEYLRPDHINSTLLTAQLLEKLGQYEAATEAYNRIPRDNPAFLAAELGRAEALSLADNNDAAIEVLQQLAKSHSGQAAVHIDLGDLMRSLDRFEEAAASYDKAIALFDTSEISQWVTYFARGISNERLGNWEISEADFRTALELNPEQPQVLNYLGYSFVELQINLDEALDMIERAVKARPNDAYITDSLGWVFYRLDRFEEAVAPMEKAAALMPVDPVINDHLGDVYWAVGRKREAEFQWNRAMSFDPEEEDAPRIRRKLEVGLDIVLEEEGKDPISVANDD